MFAFIIDQFLQTQHIVVSRQDIRNAVWNNFGVNFVSVDEGIGRLIDLGVVIRKAGSAIARQSPPITEIGARVASKAFGEGEILALNKSSIPSVRVKFDDGVIRNIAQSSLANPVQEIKALPNDLFELARLVEAEETIAQILSNNKPIQLSDEDLKQIESALDDAATLLNRPGLKAAAALIFPGDTSPIMGVALAGRAASVLRNAAIWWHDGVPVTMNASTIHRALQMESVEDDEFVAYGAIECRGLVSEESSMDSSSLMAATLKSTSARHIIFIGDEHQLQPIGSGSPFRDMIASNVIPTIYLTENYRTNCLINVAVREALGYPADELIVDDIVLVTSNDYEAPHPDAISDDDTEKCFQW